MDYLMIRCLITWDPGIFSIPLWGHNGLPHSYYLVCAAVKRASVFSRLCEVTYTNELQRLLIFSTLNSRPFGVSCSLHGIWEFCLSFGVWILKNCRHGCVWCYIHCKNGRSKFSHSSLIVLTNIWPILHDWMHVICIVHLLSSLSL